MSYLNKQTNIYFNIHLNQISELTETSKLIYSALFTQAYITSRNTELTAFTLSQKDLIATLKISKKNVISSIKQLKEFCLITTYLSKDKLNTYFKINDPVSKEEITEFHKKSLFEVKDGYAYNQIILIPAEIIQLDETPSIRLAIGELKFAWMDSKNKNKQYYNLCNIKQAEKVLFKNFTKTLRTIRSKGYIKYDVSYCGKFSGYKNIVFDFNIKQEENKIDLPKAQVSMEIKAEEETIEDIKIETETIKAPVANASKAEEELNNTEHNYNKLLDFLNSEKTEQVENKEEKMTDEEFDAILAAADDSPITKEETKAPISVESKAFEENNETIESKNADASEAESIESEKIINSNYTIEQFKNDRNVKVKIMSELDSKIEPIIKYNNDYNKHSKEELCDLLALI